MAVTALTSTATTIQNGSVPASWNNSGNTVEGIATGGTGSRRQGAGTGGTGGGGGAYGLRSNVKLNAGGSYYYYIPAAVTPSGTPANPGDSWFNDLNIFLQSATLNAGIYGSSGIAAPTAAVGVASAYNADSWNLSSSVSNGVHYLYQSLVTNLGGITLPTGVVTVSISAWAKPNATNFISVTLNTAVSTYGTLVVNVATGASNSFTSGSGSAVTNVTLTPSNGGYIIQATLTAGNYTAGGGYWLEWALSDSLTPTLGAGGEPSFNSASAGQYSVYIDGLQGSFGSQLKSYTATTTVGQFSLFLKGGTSGTTTTAGTGGAIASSQAGSGFNGGGGFKPAVSTGGGGGGAAGPRGAGATATSATGGTGDNGNTAAGANGSYAPWTGGTYGAGGGGTGPGTGAGAAGGTYGAGGSGAGNTSNANGGAGTAGLFFLTWTPPVIAPRKNVLLRM